MITPMNGVLSSLARQDSYNLWHTCFGHVLKNALQQAPLHIIGLFTISVLVSMSSYKECAMKKMANWPFLLSDERATQSLALVHMDHIGSIPVEPHLHAKYILTFIDDYSGYALVAFIYNKDATAQHFSLWLAGLRPSLVNHSPLYIQTVGGNSWAKSFKHSFHPEALLIKHQFPKHYSKMVMQIDSIKLCLKKLKPYDNMLICLDPSGKKQLKQPCMFITNTLCIVINGRHPLEYSMETNLISHTSGYLAHMLTCLYS